ncbi:Bardet-Biedl syndrome 1 protein [Chytriomyces hyalinus]|nr:Bardet-Biedl syndrome 1 protein [Chytriomyces hyalinus]
MRNSESSNRALQNLRSNRVLGAISSLLRKAPTVSSTSSSSFNRDSQPTIRDSTSTLTEDSSDPVRHIPAESKELDSGTDSATNLSQSLSSDTLDAAGFDAEALSARVNPFYVPPNKRASRVLRPSTLNAPDAKHATSSKQIPEDEPAPVPAEKLEEETVHDVWMKALEIESTGILNPFQACTALVNVDGVGNTNLVVADLAGIGKLSNATSQNLNNPTNMFTSIKVFQGHRLLNEHIVPAPPVALVHFYPDSDVTPRIPVTALGSGPDVFMYHANTPFQRFTLPFIKPHPQEEDAWKDLSVAVGAALSQAAECSGTGFVDDEVLQFAWNRIVELRESGAPITRRSLQFISGCPDMQSRRAMVNNEALTPLLIQPDISCMTVLNRNSFTKDAQAMLVVGTEQGILYLVSPPQYSVVEQRTLLSPIAHLGVIGLYEKEFTICCACRDGSIQIISSTKSKSMKRILFDVLLVGVIGLRDHFIVASMKKQVFAYTTEAHLMYSFSVPSPITAIEKVETNSTFCGYAVAMMDGQVHLYDGRDLVSKISANGSVCSIRFGDFGRDSSCLVMITSTGELDVRILRRNARLLPLKPAVADPAVVKVSASQFPIPKKTRGYLDLMKRERENSKEMYQKFQLDLMHLRLVAERATLNNTKRRLNPVCEASNLKLSAEVKGFGPTYRIYVRLLNAGTDTLENVYVLLAADSRAYSIDTAGFEVAVLFSEQCVQRSSLMHARQNMNEGVSDMVQVFVFEHGVRNRVLIANKIPVPLN